ncbi:MAG: two-component regulator propeller domain-containing protein [Segetibacter sp.]
MQNNKLTGIAENNGSIMLITDTALVTVNEHLKFVQVVPYTFGNKHLYNPEIKAKNIYTIFRRNGEMIIPDQSRLIIYRPADKSFHTIALPEGGRNVILCMVQDGNGNIFFDYNSDIYVLSPQNKLSIWKSKEYNPPQGAISMLADHSGVLWLGSDGAGIQLHDLRLDRWMGRPYEKNFQEDVLQRCLQVPPSEIKKTFLYNMLPYLFRWTRGSNGKLWLSMAGNGYNRQPELCYYKDGNLFSPPWQYTETSRNTHININGIALSASGKLWGIDFFFRPIYFDTLTHAVTVFPSVASVNFLQEFTVSSLLIDGEDVFWISTAHDGLCCHDKRSGKTIHYSYSDMPGSLPVNQLMNMVQDPLHANILWIASMGGGLLKFDKATGKCQAFTTSDGLPNNTVYAVTIDANGILWCSSNKGIFSFHPKTLAVRTFLLKDGLSGDEFNRYHFLQLPDGRDRLWRSGRLYRIQSVTCC